MTYVIKIKNEELYLFDLGFTMSTINEKELATKFTKAQAEGIIKKSKKYEMIKAVKKWRLKFITRNTPPRS